MKKMGNLKASNKFETGFITWKDVNRSAARLRNNGKNLNDVRNVSFAAFMGQSYYESMLKNDLCEEENADYDRLSLEHLKTLSSILNSFYRSGEKNFELFGDGHFWIGVQVFEDLAKQMTDRVYKEFFDVVTRKAQDAWLQKIRPFH
jgi:hypothetical protein